MFQKITNLNIIQIYNINLISKLKNFFFLKFKFNLFIPKISVTENIFKRILPYSGDLVIIKFNIKYNGLRSSFFKLYLCFGMCISHKKNDFFSYFIIRNSYKRNAFEFSFYIYSPLIYNLKIYSNRRKCYNKTSLFFLRIKKIALSKIIL
jgi:ribosomal protein L19